MRPSALSASGPLHEAVRKAAAGPVHRRGIDEHVVLIEELDIARGEIVGIAPDRRQDVVAEDARRHGPGRVDDEIGHLGLEDRRLPIRAADLHTSAPHDVAAAQQIEPEPRDVDDQELALGIVEHPPHALEIRADLLDARGNGHVQLRERRGADDAVRPEAVPRLKIPHAVDERPRVHRPRHRRGVGRQIAGDCEPRSQGRDALVAAAGPERRPGRHARPAAVRFDRPIVGQRLLEPLVEKRARDHARRELAQRRRVDGRLDRDGGVLAVELAARVPVRIERRRVDLAEAQVIAQADDAVGQQEIEVGTLGRRQGIEIGQRAAHGAQRSRGGSR